MFSNQAAVAQVLPVRAGARAAGTHRLLACTPATHRDRDDDCPNPPLPAETRSSAHRPRSERKETRGELPSPSPAGLHFSGQQRLKESSFLANPQLAVTAPNFKKKKKNAYVFVQIKHTQHERSQAAWKALPGRAGSKSSGGCCRREGQSAKPQLHPRAPHRATPRQGREPAAPALPASLPVSWHVAFPRETQLFAANTSTLIAAFVIKQQARALRREEILKTRPNATLNVC